MKKSLLLATVATTLLAANVQAAELTPYVGAKLRYVDMSNELNSVDKFDADDSIMGASLALGLSKQLTNGALRAELEYNRNEDAEKNQTLQNIHTGDIFNKIEVESQSLMLNGYYDFNTDSQFSPYVGAGLGLAKVKASIKGAGSIDDVNFAWQVGAGVAYQLNRQVSLDAGYRHVDYGDFTKYGIDIDSDAEEIYFGARYSL